MSVGASTRWILARRRLVIVAWLLVAVIGLAGDGKGTSALSWQSASCARFGSRGRADSRRTA